MTLGSAALVPGVREVKGGTGLLYSHFRDKEPRSGVSRGQQLGCISQEIRTLGVVSD